MATGEPIEAWLRFEIGNSAMEDCVEFDVFIELSPALLKEELAVIVEVPGTLANKDGKLFIAYGHGAGAFAKDPCVPMVLLKPVLMTGDLVGKLLGPVVII